MTINFENYGRFYVLFYYDDDTYDSYYKGGDGYNLKEAMDFISNNMENSLSIISADIADMETGEIIIIIESDD